MNPNQILSYANATKTTVYTKECAIVIPALENTEWRNAENDYLEALASLIDPSNIISIFPTSNKRIVVYFKTKEIAKTFVTKYPTIQIQQINLPTRCLVSPARRLFISGVHPIIENEIIYQKLKDLNIKIMSEITNINVFTKNPLFRHILTARRQIYIDPEDTTTIPETIEIISNGESHQIYLNAEEIKCKNCGSTIHSTQRCRNIPIEHTLNADHEYTILTPTSNPSTSTVTMDKNFTPEEMNIEDPKIDNLPFKRSHPPSLSNSQESEQDLPQPKTIKTTSDKEAITIPTTITPTVTEENVTIDLTMDLKSPTVPKIKKSTIKILEILKIPLEREPNKFILNYEKFKKFIQDIEDKKKIDTILKKYEIQPEHIIEMLETLHEYPSNTTQSKSFITRLKNKITLNKNETDSENVIATTETE